MILLQRGAALLLWRTLLERRWQQLHSIRCRYPARGWEREQGQARRSTTWQSRVKQPWLAYCLGDASSGKEQPPSFCLPRRGKNCWQHVGQIPPRKKLSCVGAQSLK